MHVHSDILRISPKYSSNNWAGLSKDQSSDWAHAVEIVRDRLEGRFLRFVDSWLTDQFSGFIVLAIDSLLAETIEQFRSGATNGEGKSRKYISKFLSRERFQQHFDENARTRFFEDIRCGLLHQAEAKGMWLIRRNQSTMLKPVNDGKGYIIDVERFHAGVQGSLNDYLEHLLEPANSLLRSNLWKKMDHICSVRTARGALYEGEHQDGSA